MLRRSIQLAFLFLNVWLGVAFYFWVRRMETGAPGRIVVRPAGVEGWLPIAGLMNLKYWLTTGRVPASHPALLFLLVTFLAIARSYSVRRSAVGCVLLGLFPNISGVRDGRSSGAAFRSRAGSIFPCEV